MRFSSQIASAIENTTKHAKVRATNNTQVRTSKVCLFLSSFLLFNMKKSMGTIIGSPEDKEQPISLRGLYKDTTAITQICVVNNLGFNDNDGTDIKTVSVSTNEYDGASVGWDGFGTEDFSEEKLQTIGENEAFGVSPGTTNCFSASTSSSSNILSVVFQPTSSTYYETTQLNFIVIQLQNSNSVSATFLQGGYTSSTIDNIGAPRAICETFPNIYQASCSSNCPRDVYSYSPNVCQTDPESSTNVFHCPYNYDNTDNFCFPDETPSGINFIGTPAIFVQNENIAYITLEETTFDNYFTEWELVGVGGGLSTQFSSSFSTSESKTQSSSTTRTNSFTEGISSSTGVKFAGVSESITVSSSASQSFSNTMSRSVSQSESKTVRETNTCKTNVCDGRLYQWKVSGTSKVTGETSFISDCYFVCVPHHVDSPPRCPLGYCGEASCQCCNAAYWDGAQSNLDSFLITSPNNCAPGCTASGKPCALGSDCCSNRCDYSVNNEYATCA